jgi:hypothetical protein
MIQRLQKNFEIDPLPANVVAFNNRVSGARPRSVL